MALFDRIGPWARGGLNSVRGRLVLLTISLLAPAVLSMGFVLAGADRQTRGQMHEQLLTTARALSGAIDRQAAVGTAVAETLSSDQALLAGDWAAFHARARRVTDDRNGWVVVSDQTGQQVVNTLRPYGTPLPRSPRLPGMDEAFRAGKSKLSDLRMGTVAKKPVITVGAPLEIKGKIYVLSYVVEAASFTSVFREQRVPDRWVATLLDNNRKVIARSARNEVWTGHTASADMAENLRRSNEGVNKSRSFDGVPTMVAYTRSPQTGWTLVVAIPRADLARTVTFSVVAASAIFVLLLALGIGLAFFFSRGINREVGGLVAAAAGIGRGEAVAPNAGRLLEETAAIQDALAETSAELQAREERQKVMINELNHRVKNTLATVQALARQTFGKVEGAPVEVFTERLISLSAAHDLLTRTGWREADLGELVRLCTRAHGERVECAGPKVSLNPNMAVSLSMVFHELATNSAKYGALSSPNGRVRIVWRMGADGAGLHFSWTESGGPVVKAPETQGFGTRLIEASIRRELRGEPRFDFRPLGLVFEAELPVSRALRWSNSF